MHKICGYWCETASIEGAASISWESVVEERWQLWESYFLWLALSPLTSLTLLFGDNRNSDSEKINQLGFSLWKSSYTPWSQWKPSQVVVLFQKFNCFSTVSFVDKILINFYRATQLPYYMPLSCVCVWVCVSVTCHYCIQMAKLRIMQQCHTIVRRLVVLWWKINPVK